MSDPSEFRQVMRQLPAGVVVITTVSVSGWHAMTATSFTSVSLDPALVSFCVGRSTRFYDAIRDAEFFAVSLLAADQAGVAQHFATSGRDLASQFAGISHRVAPNSGAPWILGANGWLDCRNDGQHASGDHLVVMGEVLTAESGAQGPDAPGGLGYFRSQYRDVSDLAAYN